MAVPFLSRDAAAEAAAVRLRWALLASLLLHGLLAMPLGRWLQPAQRPVDVPPIEARLALPVPDPVDEITTLPTPSAVAAVPAAVPPAPTFQPRPPPTLRGRDLARATAALSEELFYPREAIERGLEGRVILLLHLDPAGRVAAVEVAASSGHAVLDVAAQQAAGRLAGVGGTARQVLLPVDFRLE